MLSPFFYGANHTSGTVRGEDGLLQFKSVPMSHRVPHRLAIFRHTQHAKGGSTEVSLFGYRRWWLLPGTYYLSYPVEGTSVTYSHLKVNQKTTTIITTKTPTQ